jgi:hypothetical protein
MDKQIQGKITVEPLVIDFGQKHSANSPIHREFRIQNNTAQSVIITEVSSGCGCTVVNFPREPIAPDTVVIVPVKINLLRYSGDFTNKIKVRTDTGKTFDVDIKGEITNDPWSTESSLRCTYENDQPAKGILEIHTANYPDIQFDPNYIDKNITITEISRNTQDGETTLKFEVVINTKELVDSDVTLLLKPTDSKIVPITVQIYCFNNETTMPVPELRTKMIALGIVASKQIVTSIYGDADLITVIKQSEFVGLPNNVSVEIVSSSDSNALRLLFQFSPVYKEENIEGMVKLITKDKQELILPVNGYLAYKTEN